MQQWFLQNSAGGIYSVCVWQNPVTKEMLQTFSVLTVSANELCLTIYNRGKNPFTKKINLNYTFFYFNRLKTYSNDAFKNKTVGLECG